MRWYAALFLLLVVCIMARAWWRRWRINALADKLTKMPDDAVERLIALSAQRSTRLHARFRAAADIRTSRKQAATDAAVRAAEVAEVKVARARAASKAGTLTRDEARAAIRARGEASALAYKAAEPED